jgi:hypothetical protein
MVLCHNWRLVSQCSVILLVIYNKTATDSILTRAPCTGSDCKAGLSRRGPSKEFLEGLVDDGHLAVVAEDVYYAMAWV